jgi:hypothetical protein
MLLYAHAAVGLDVFNERWSLRQTTTFIAPFGSFSGQFEASASRTSVAPSLLFAAGLERDIGANWFLRGEAFVAHAFWEDASVRVANSSGAVTFPAGGDRTTYGVNLGVGLRF